MSNVHRRSDIHRTRRNTQQSSMWNFPYWEVEKTSRENTRDRNLSSHSQKYSTPTTDAHPPPPMKLPSSFSLLLSFAATESSVAAPRPPTLKSYLWMAPLSRSLGDTGVRAAMALVPGAMWAGKLVQAPKMSFGSQKRVTERAQQGRRDSGTRPLCEAYKEENTV